MLLQDGVVDQSYEFRFNPSLDLAYVERVSHEPTRFEPRRVDVRANPRSNHKR